MSEIVSNDDAPEAKKPRLEGIRARSSGRMSLRPNRRIDVEGLKSENEEVEEEEEDSGEESLSEKKKLGRVECKVDAETPLSEKGEEVCGICSCPDLNQKKLSDSRKLFMDFTSSGTPLFEILKSVLGPSLDDSFSDSDGEKKVCGKCYGSLNTIESLYVQLRKATDALKDTFLLGQRILDADVKGGKVALVSQKEERSFTDFIDAKLLTLKVADGSVLDFNASGVGTDFNLRIQKIYNGSIVNDEEMEEESEEDTITLTFDVNTGAIQKSMADISETEVSTETYDANQPIFYVTRKELDENFSKKVVKNKYVLLKASEFDRCAKKLILGHKISHQIVLSGELSQSLKTRNFGRQFICGDCSTSFKYFNSLSNHVYLSHKSGKPEVIRPSELVAKVGTKKTLTKTGEVPTLDRPFQCEHCDKCFAEYLNMSTHVDHYHGYNRTCNVEGCQTVCCSIQDFTLHYVRHRDPSFEFPTDFRQKTKILLTCPLCALRVQGLWKFFGHTYTHDREPRFKCPVCAKRMHKVQNFREHLLRHRGPEYKNRKCPLCDKSFFPQDLNRHIKQVHNQDDPNVAGHICKKCDKNFGSNHELIIHMELHSRKESWNHKCTLCLETFPSLSRHKIHCKEVHPCKDSSEEDEGLEFRKECDTSFSESSSQELQEELGNFQCMECSSRNSTLIAARKHYRLSHKDKPFSCFICKKIFEREETLHEHLEGIHPEVVGHSMMKDEFPCTFCEQSFAKHLERLRHIRFIHLVETIDIREMKEEMTVIGDQVSEYDEDFQNIIKLHSIP